MINRRDFLKYCICGMPGFIAAPALLSSCTKEDSAEFLQTPNFSGRIGIIGAGAAGLYIADMLTHRGYDVFILEASGVVGGRVRQLSGFADFDADLGAESVRGQISILDVLVSLAGKQFIQTSLIDFCSYENSLKKIADIANQTDYLKAVQVIQNIINYSGSDIPVSDYIAQQGVPSAVLNIARARLGNYYGTSNERLGVLSLAKQLRKWSAGSEILYLKNGSLYEVLLNRFGYLLNKVMLNSPVKEIDYSGKQVLIKDLHDNSYACDRLALTVPVSALREDFIKFSPSLPAKKIEAISAIDMGGGIKIILKFINRFWENKMGSLTGEGVVPEYRSAGSGGRSAENCILTASVFGAEADYAGSHGDGIIDLIITDLKNLFGASAVNNNLAAYYIQDWKREPYIGGAFSFANPGSDEKRADLAASVDNKIYFAGEAAHTAGHFGTLHGALETAESLVKEIIQT